MINMKKLLGAVLVVGFSLCLFEQPAEAVVEIKIATVAPQGSIWMRIFNKMKAKILKKTNGEVKLRYYPGQVQGDERDVVRKMRTGQLDGGAFTAVGLAQLNSKALVLQMPGMFREYDKLDKARVALNAVMEKTFLDKGYVLLGWGEIGKLYIFSKHKIKKLSDLKKRKVWVWTDDPISKAMMRKLGVSPRLLGLPGVLPALNTGMIDTVTNSPLGCTALQWHSKLKYVAGESTAIGIGATVITKKAYDKLKPEHQKILLKYSRKYHQALLKRIRRDNTRALATLKSMGMKVMPKFDAADRKKFENAARKVTESFAPRYYPKALLKQVLKHR